MSRPATQQAAVRKRILQWILSGHWAPGERLPARPALARLAGTSLMTLQSALDGLRADGFIRTADKNGTYVADRPPHRFRFGMAFPESVEESGNGFWRCLARAARQTRADGRNIEIYTHVDAHPDSEGHRRLCRDVMDLCLAGIFFPFLPYQLLASPILAEPGLPRLVVYPKADWQGLPALQVAGFVERAILWLIKRRRSRIGLILPPGSAEEEWTRALEHHGLRSRPFWTLTVHQGCPVAAANVAHALMRAVDPQPPDAIVIADDNLVDAALLGITASGARIGRDVDVIAHCNFPADAPAAAPVHRLGYDCRRVLDLALDRLADLAAGRPIPKATVVQALFEDELGVSAHHNTRAPASRREDRSVEMSSRAQRGGRTDAGAPVPLDSGSGNGQ